MQTHCSKLLSALILATVLLSTAALAGEIRTEHVQFQQGENSSRISSSIQGYQIVDYVFRAEAGQYMNISLGTKHTATYFNLLAPNENLVAMFNGSIYDNQYEGIATKTGDYTIRVYMMRSAARRNEVAQYQLEVIKGNKAVDN